MTKQQLVIVALGTREPLTGERYLIEGDDDPGQIVTLVAPVTPDHLMEDDPALAYGTVRIRQGDGTVRVVSTLGLGVLVVPAGE